MPINNGITLGVNVITRQFKSFYTSSYQCFCIKLIGGRMKKALLLLLFMASPLYAQSVESDAYSYSLEELLKITVTGSTLTSENLKTVPSAVTVFSHKEIARMGLDTLDELMNLVPGFQSYRSSTSSHLSFFSSRGRRIGIPAAEILIVVDGQRVDEPRTSGSGNVIPKYPLMNVERIEFIRGPGAAVYGSNAMMGVVNIITRSDVNEVSLGYGNLHRRKAYLQSSHQIGNVGVNLFAHIEADDGDEYRVPDTFSTNTIVTDDPGDFANLNAKFQLRSTQLFLQHNQYRSENFYVLGRLSNGFNESSGQFSSIAIKQEFDWSSASSSYLWFSYSSTKYLINFQLTAPGALVGASQPTDDAFSLATGEALFLDADFSGSNELRLQWHNDWYIGQLNSLQFGVEFRHIDSPEIVSKNNFDLGDLANGIFPIRYYGELRATTVVQNESSRDIAGVYGQYQHLFFDTTHLTLGLRYDDFSNIGSQLSPRVGLVHELSNNHSLKLLYGEAYRAPAENELFLVNNPVLVGNPDLDSETVQSWDLIWVGQWPDTGISLGYFESRFQDAIVQLDIGGGILKQENADQDPSKGVEFELSHQLNERWLLRTSYTYISEKADVSFREASQLGSLMVNYQQDRWNANLVAIRHGEREMNAVAGEVLRLSNYWQVFAKLRVNVSPGWQLSVQLKNLLDKDYVAPSNNSPLTQGVPYRGREVLVESAWYF